MGDETKVRERFANGVTDLRITSYMYPFVYLFGPSKVVDFFIEYYGPTHRAYGSLDDDKKREFHSDLTAMWTANNIAEDGTTKVKAEYIEVIATRA